mmetsp:Transcript_25420/g.55699  ORF Transcript_25420/g.55699 Transcript_25420/m.55699 type:complete len:90 (+) Transcript_25420:819-1088(+)
MRACVSACGTAIQITKKRICKPKREGLLAVKRICKQETGYSQKEYRHKYQKHVLVKAVESERIETPTQLVESSQVFQRSHSDAPKSRGF